MNFIVICYGLLLTLLFVYGLNILYLSFWAWRWRAAKPMLFPLAEDYPRVTIQIPIYNERYVARRVIEAVCQMRWQPDCLEIQILDDSTDSTIELVEALVQYHYQQGINIKHLHRTVRSGYKAGALAAGLAQAGGDYIAIFDADFLPAPDFLERTMPHFVDDNVAFVQTRWGHLNADYSPLTRLQAIAIDAHFMIEQYARYHAGFFLNFNGTAGIWRREAIEAAGGWQANTLTEDLELSYRAQFAGWKACYVRDIVTPAEIPVTLKGFRRQQYRWARGSIECARLLMPQLLSTSLPLKVKLQGILHLTGYGVQVLMTLVALLYPFVIHFMARQPEQSWLFDLTAIFTLTFLAPTLYFMIGQIEKRQPWFQQIKWILLLNVFGAGIMYQSAYAVLHALIARKPMEFERTPKFGIMETHERWQEKAYQLHFSPLAFFELMMLFYNLNTLCLAVDGGYWSIAFFAGLFVLGGIMVLLMTLWQEFQQRYPIPQRRQAQRSVEG